MVLRIDLSSNTKAMTQMIGAAIRETMAAIHMPFHSPAIASKFNVMALYIVAAIPNRIIKTGNAKRLSRHQRLVS